MSLKGGYQIIDFKNEPFDSERATSNYYKNIYHDIANSHAKMIIISGLNLDGVKYNDYEVIFYDVREDNDILYQCILRRIWDTANYKCYTKFCTIYPDDTVKCTVDNFTYEIMPDNDFNIASTNALQNKVITEKFGVIDNSISTIEDTMNTKFTDVNKDITNLGKLVILPNDTIHNVYTENPMGELIGHMVLSYNFLRLTFTNSISVGTAMRYKIYIDLVSDVAVNYFSSKYLYGMSQAFICGFKSGDSMITSEFYSFSDSNVEYTNGDSHIIVNLDGIASTAVSINNLIVFLP